MVAARLMTGYSFAGSLAGSDTRSAVATSFLTRPWRRPDVRDCHARSPDMQHRAVTLDPRSLAADNRAVVRLIRGFLALRARLSVLVTVVLAVVLSGCGWTPGPPTRLSESDKLQQQAQAALTRWADAVAAARSDQGVVLVGDLTAQVGIWEPEAGSNNKPALMAGLVEAAVSLPAATGGEGEVQWQDGTTTSVPVVSAEQAVAGIRTDARAEDCPDCGPLQITGARLTSGPAATSRGSAIVPMWEFTLRGTAVTVTRIAIADPVTVALPPWNGVPWGNAEDAPAGISIDSATTTVGGRELTAGFVGVPVSADQVCGADYTTEAVESSLAVVVIVTAHPNGAGGACDAVGARRTASVTLASPLGERTVLEVVMGRPVPVRLTP